MAFSREAARQQAQIPDVQYTADNARVACSWSPWQDEQGLREYLWGIAESPGGLPEVVPWTSNGLRTVVWGVPARLSDGKTYYCVVLVVNQAGIQRRLSSDGFVVDRSQPQPPPMRPGPSEYPRVPQQNDPPILDSAYDRSIRN